MCRTSGLECAELAGQNVTRVHALYLALLVVARSLVHMDHRLQVLDLFSLVSSCFSLLILHEATTRCHSLVANGCLNPCIENAQPG
jgi:hypothetical protein